MNELGGMRTAWPGQSVRKGRVDFARDIRLVGLRPLFDNTSCIDHSLGSKLGNDGGNAFAIAHVSAIVGVSAIKQAVPRIVAEPVVQRDTRLVARGKQMPQQAMPQHTVPTEDQDAHRRLEPISKRGMGNG